MLIADRAFPVGQPVEIGRNEGVVESVGLRTTRIRRLEDSPTTIPNADPTPAHVTNFGARRHRHFQTRLNVPHGRPPEVSIEFRDGLLALIRHNPGLRLENQAVARNDLG